LYYTHILNRLRMLLLPLLLLWGIILRRREACQ
jgi:hypothetical protein